MFSAIFASMNRERELGICLPSWLKINKIKDCVIVDWSSDVPLIENVVIQKLIKQDRNIKIIRVENQKYFYRCLAWNLAFQNTCPDNKILIKLDADHYNLNHYWVDNLSLTEDNILKDYFCAGTSDMGFKLYGFMVINKKHFNEGYNENIDAIWGCEDAELYERIQKKYGIHMDNSIGSGYVFHLPHSEEQRFQKLKSKVRYLWKKGNLEPSFNKMHGLLNVGKDGKGLPTRRDSKNFYDWTPAKYRILEESLVYRRVELED